MDSLAQLFQTLVEMREHDLALALHMGRLSMDGKPLHVISKSGMHSASAANVQERWCRAPRVR